jgi:hypothetical protein
MSRYAVGYRDRDLEEMPLNEPDTGTGASSECQGDHELSLPALLSALSFALPSSFHHTPRYATLTPPTIHYTPRSHTDVSIIPSRTWVEEAMRANGQEPPSDPDQKPSLLGLSLRVCNPANALESVYHVLDVLEGSPAEVSEA